MNVHAHFVIDCWLFGVVFEFAFSILVVVVVSMWPFDSQTSEIKSYDARFHVTLFMGIFGQASQSLEIAFAVVICSDL